MPQAIKIPAAKAAVENEWGQLEKFPEWQLTKVRNKKDVIEEARNKGRKVNFASLMDICHLKNAELEAKHQKYKGRIVPRGDIVKDDSGSCAVFTEQGSSASPMTAAKSHGCHLQTATVRWTGSRRSISLHPSKNGRCSQMITKIPELECPDIWIRLPRHKWPQSWSSMEDTVVLLERNFVMVIL